MKKILAVFLIMSAMLITPAFSYPTVSSFLVQPIPATYNTTQALSVDLTMTGLDDTCYIANSGNVKWYWLDLTSPNPYVRDRIASCDGSFSCTYYPNSTAYSGNYRIMVSIPGQYSSTCYQNTIDFPIGNVFVNPGTSAGWISYFDTHQANTTAYHFNYYVAPPEIVPNVSYTCNLPEVGLYQPIGFGLNCVDNSSQPVSTYNWGLSQPDGTWYNTTNSTLAKSLYVPGWYGLSYTACNTAGCGTKNNAALVNITDLYIPATGIKFWVHTYDPGKSAKISGSSIMIQNLTSGGWRNVSTSAGSAYFDATNYARTELLTQGQNVKVCGSAAGYATTCANVTIAYNDWEYILNMVSTSDTPIGTNTTLIVNVINTYTAETLSGATITVSNTSVPYSSSKLSDAGGIATFPNIPAGTYQIVASKAGYQTSTTSWPTTAGTVANAYIGLTLTGMTPIATDTSGQPLYDENGNPIIGYDLNGNPITAGPTPDTRTSDEKDEDMMDTLRTNGPFLIEFFIMCFVLYMISGIGRK